MKFHIYSCRLTIELCTEARLAGLEDVWTPTTWVKTLRRPANQAPYYEEVLQPAVYGYVYVPVHRTHSFRRWVPQKYATKVVTVQGGRGFMTKDQAMLHRTEAVVDLVDLQDHDEAVRALRSITKPQSAPSELSKGDQVSFLLPHGVGKLTGEVVGFRGGNRAQVVCDQGKFTVDITHISKISDKS